MGRRIDYVDDPNAPAANSVVPSVVAIVLDESGRVLLIHKTDNDLWALPGGGHEAGESIADTVVREVKEETGYDVEVDRLTGTYTNPGHVMAYEDGEVRQQFSLAFTAKVTGGEPTNEQRERPGRVGRGRQGGGSANASIHAPTAAARNRRPATALHRLTNGTLCRTLRTRRQVGARPCDSAMNGILRGVATEDVIQPLRDGHRLPSRAGREIREDESVKQVLPWTVEARQLMSQSALICLVLGPGVKRHQRDNLGRRLDRLEVQGAIDGMHARSPQTV